jgi:hypothetical protein
VGNATAERLVQAIPSAAHERWETATLGRVDRERFELQFKRFRLHFAI